MCDRRKRGSPERMVALPLSIISDDNECISTQLCGRLVIELIKHVVYWRGQIPASAEQLQHFDATSANNQMTEQNCTGSSLRVARQRSTTTRIQQWSSTLCNISKDITTIFSTVQPNAPIRQVALVFGATPVSPKETHIIRMPANLLADTNIPITPLDTRKYFSNLFKALVIHAAAIDLPLISPTNMFTLIKVDGQLAEEKGEGDKVLPQIQQNVKFSGGKGFKFIYYVNCNYENIGERPRDDPISEVLEDKMPGCTWYRLRHVLKGFS